MVLGRTSPTTETGATQDFSASTTGFGTVCRGVSPTISGGTAPFILGKGPKGREPIPGGSTAPRATTGLVAAGEGSIQVTRGSQR